MKQRSDSYWSLLPLPLWIAIFACALLFMILFCWLTTVYHWYRIGAAYASTGWLQYLGLAAMSFTFALMALSAIPVGLKRAHMTSIPWYMQGDVLRGIIGIALVALIVLNGIASVSDSSIMAAGQAFCLLIVIAACVWAWIAPTKKYRQKDNGQLKESR
jgi:hypothetical protein